VAADILGQRVDRQVGAVRERRLEDRAEQRIVAGDDRPGALAGSDLIGDASHQRDVDERVHRIRRRLDEDHGHAAARERALRRAPDVTLVETVLEADAANIETREAAVDEHLGAAVERKAVQDRVPGSHIGENGRGDRGHAGREDEAVLRLLIDGQPILDDLEVRMIEA
jgi:hypothetical protein